MTNDDIRDYGLFGRNDDIRDYGLFCPYDGRLRSSSDPVAESPTDSHLFI